MSEMKQYESTKIPRIEKHKNGYYYLHHEGRITSLKTKLQYVAAEKLAQYKKGVDVFAGMVLFPETVAQYLEKGASHLAETTLARYKYCLEEKLKPHFQDTPVQRIKVKQVREYLQSRKAPANTVLKDLIALSALLAWCVGEGYLEYNPCRQLERKHRPSPRKLVHPNYTPSEADLNRVAAEIKHPRSLLFFWSLATTGARVNELRQANITDLDMDIGVLTVRRKGGKRDVVFLDDRVMTLLKEDLEKRKQKAEVQPSDPMFLNRYGTRMCSIARALRFACKRAKVPHMGHHALRHGFVSIAHEQGLTIEEIRALAGHAPGSQITEEIYLEIKKQRLLKAAASLKIGDVKKK